MKKDNDIVIVTGFFDCKRGEHTLQNRTNDKYFEYFEFWARIQNDVIIFGNEDTIKRALEIRKKFGRENQTHTICIEDITLVEKNIYNKMLDIEQRGGFKSWRIRDFDISNESMYNYVMFMKSWMLKKASEYLNKQCNLAWVDFGFNQGGAFYKNAKEFDYYWDYNFSLDKIHFFSLGNHENEIGYLKLMLMTDQIMGGIYICHSGLCQQFYEIMRQSLLGLISLDLFDDDQMLMTMGYKLYPNLFEIHESDWFYPLKQCGGEHLTTIINKSDKKMTLSHKRKSYIYLLKAIYIRLFHRQSVQQYEYIKRLATLIKNYH